MIGCTLRGTVIALAFVAVADAQEMTPRDVHDAIAQILAQHRQPIAGADTFVTWAPGPILYHAITRDADSLVTWMARNDLFVGRAVVRFANARPTHAKITWWPDSIRSRQIAIVVRGDSLVVTDSVTLMFPVPREPWSIADYGTDDLLVPVLVTLDVGGPFRIRAFRPYGAKWDDLTVIVREVDGGREYDVGGAPDDRHLLRVTSSGDLVQILRTKLADSERRPLETGRLTLPYVRLRSPRP